MALKFYDEIPSTTEQQSAPSRALTFIPQKIARVGESIAGLPGNFYELLRGQNRRQAAQQDIESLNIPEQFKNILQEAQQDYQTSVPLPTSADIKEKVTYPLSKKIFGSEQALDPTNKIEEFTDQVAEVLPFLLNPTQLAEKGITSGVLNALSKGIAGKGTAELTKQLGGNNLAQGLSELAVYSLFNFSPQRILKEAENKFNMVEQGLETFPIKEISISDKVRNNIQKLNKRTKLGYKDTILKNWMNERLSPFTQTNEVNAQDIFYKMRELNNEFGTNQIPKGGESFYKSLKTDIIEPIIKDWSNKYAPGLFQDLKSANDIYSTMANSSSFKDAINKLADNKSIGFTTQLLLLGYPLGLGKAAMTLGGAQAGKYVTNRIEPLIKSPAVRSILNKTIKDGITGNISGAIAGSKKLDKIIDKKYPEGKTRFTFSDEIQKK